MYIETFSQYVENINKCLCLCVLESSFFDEPEEDVDRLSLAARLEREEQSLSDESADEDSKGRPPFVLLRLNILLLLNV